jgi:hypothetical protein
VPNAAQIFRISGLRERAFTSPLRVIPWRSGKRDFLNASPQIIDFAPQVITGVNLYEALGGLVGQCIGPSEFALAVRFGT